MSRKKTSQRESPRKLPAMTRRKGQVAIAIAVALSLFASWRMLAYLGPFDSAFSQKGAKRGTVSTASLNSNSPSKEYVYAGGRLVATEEPAASSLSAPANLRATTASSTTIQITWNSVTGAARYELQRSSNYGDLNNHGFISVSSNPVTPFTDTVTTGNAYIYQVRAFDSGNNASSFSNIDVATAIAFTDDPVVAGLPVREVHITQLRQAVDAVRVASGLSAATWTDPPPLAQIISIKKAHVDQLRSNLDAARSALSLPDPTSSYTDPIITQFSTPVRHAHIHDLRRLVKGYRTVTG